MSHHKQPAARPEARFCPGCGQPKSHPRAQYCDTCARLRRAKSRDRDGCRPAMGVEHYLFRARSDCLRPGRARRRNQPRNQQRAPGTCHRRSSPRRRRRRGDVQRERQLILSLQSSTSSLQSSGELQLELTANELAIIRDQLAIIFFELELTANINYIRDRNFPRNPKEKSRFIPAH